MESARTRRLAWGVALAVLVAAIAYPLAGTTAAVVTLFGAVAAALVAGTGGNGKKAFARPAARDEPPLGEVLDALVSPVLLVRGGRVAHANAPSRALLGAHIVGEDVRVALRHPAATERLAAPQSGPADRPTELVGLGTLDQHWLMRIGEASDGTRIVHLADETGHHATERMRVDFVANASHELRTPLASILGFAETLADEAGEDPALRTRFLGIMADEARRMQRLVEDLLSLSRIESDKHRLPSARVEFDLLMMEVCAEIRRAGGARVADLECQVATEPAPVAGDEAQLSQLLHNLVGNALKYGRPGTPVTLALTTNAATLTLTVTDEGDGIAPEHIPRLTERFYRVDAGRSRALGGTGLGLAIVKHIVERHRGRFDITSRVGTGTTVTVTLPLLG